MDVADAKEDNTFSDFTLARPRKQNLDDRPRDIQHSASNVLLDVLAYPIHRYGLISRTSSKRSDFGNTKIHKAQLGGKPYEVLRGRCPTFPGVLGVLAMTSTLPGYRETNIIVLGNCSNHHICLRFRSGWCQNIPDSSSLERKIKVCNTNRQGDVARFLGNDLPQQAPKHELVLLHTCYHAVSDKHDHIVVL